VILPIAFLTGMGDVDTSVQAMGCGAVDFRTKPIDGGRLFATVGQSVQRDAEQRTLLTLQRVIRQYLDTITPREREVMTQSFVGFPPTSRILARRVATDSSVGGARHRLRHEQSNAGYGGLALIRQIQAYRSRQAETVRDWKLHHKVREAQQRQTAGAMFFGAERHSSDRICSLVFHSE
jgi:FixJ family two-component response regulator